MNRIKLAFIIACASVLAVSCGGSPERSDVVDYEMSYSFGPVTFEMVKAPAGNFTMGVSADNRRKVTRGIAQPVALGGFVISREPVTQALWTEVMGKNPSSTQDPSSPVDMVSWEDIQKFLSKLSKRTGKTFSLPTEAQWEYSHHLFGEKDFVKVAEWCFDYYDEVPGDKTSDDYFKPMNEVYAKYYPTECPARAAFAVQALPLGALVEIETIAVK